MKIKYPSNWRVIFINDEVTPIGFVVYLLIEVFKLPEDEAMSLTYKIHNEGSGVAGTYLKSIAETKRNIALDLTNKAGWPLKIELEECN